VFRMIGNLTLMSFQRAKLFVLPYNHLAASRIRPVAASRGDQNFTDYVLAYA
jgi:hypothetical protein